MKVEFQGKQESLASWSRGFTLIETFVAVTILLIALLGPLTLATRGLFTAIVARDQLTASYLAQDAIEYIRHKRDSNFIDGDSWLSGDISSCISPKSCLIDTAGDSISECQDGECPNLLYNKESGFYGYGDISNDNSVTQFRRVVTLTPVVGNPGNEYTLDVTMSWKTGLFENSFTSSENIFNWFNP